MRSAVREGLVSGPDLQDVPLSERQAAIGGLPLSCIEPSLSCIEPLKPVRGQRAAGAPRAPAGDCYLLYVTFLKCGSTSISRPS